MNIKITKEECNILLTYSAKTVQFGNLSGKDTDLLHIVTPNKQMDNLAVEDNHTLFYKDESSNTDHLFITPKGFIKALMTGGSTLSYEVLISEALRGSILDFLYENDISVYWQHYKGLKSFLGTAKRDLKQSYKHKEPEKKLKWVSIYVDLVSASAGCKDDGDLSDQINYLREGLNRQYQNREIPFSVSDNVYSELQAELNNMKTLDIPELNSLSSHYFNTWSNNNG